MESEKVMDWAASRAEHKAGLQSPPGPDTMEFIVKMVFLLCGFVAVGCVLFICIYLIIAGLPAILEIGVTDFLFGTEWAGKQEKFGILPFIPHLGGRHGRRRPGGGAHWADDRHVSGQGSAAQGG